MDNLLRGFFSFKGTGNLFINMELTALIVYIRHASHVAVFRSSFFLAGYLFKTQIVSFHWIFHWSGRRKNPGWGSFRYRLLDETRITYILDNTRKSVSRVFRRTTLFSGIVRAHYVCRSKFIGQSARAINFAFWRDVRGTVKREFLSVKNVIYSGKEYVVKLQQITFIFYRLERMS